MNDRVLVGRPVWCLVPFVIIVGHSQTCIALCQSGTCCSESQINIPVLLQILSMLLQIKSMLLQCKYYQCWCGFLFCIVWIGTLLKYKVTLDISSSNNWQLFLSRICRRWRPFYQNLPIAKIAMPGFQLLRLISDPLTF